MRLKKIIDVVDAIAIIHDVDIVASSGYGGNGTPDELFVALEERFLGTGSPRDLTLVFADGQGDGVDTGNPVPRRARHGVSRIRRMRT